MIELTIDKKRDGLHNNLIFRIPEAKVNGQFDLYYFSIGSKELSNGNPLVELIKYWIHNVSSLVIGEYGFLPIDFSDEYTGCLRVERISQEELKLEYGLSNLEGWSINPANPGKYFKQINDFEFDNDTVPITVNREQFLDKLEQITEELKKNWT